MKMGRLVSPLPFFSGMVTPCRISQFQFDLFYDLEKTNSNKRERDEDDEKGGKAKKVKKEKKNSLPDPPEGYAEPLYPDDVQDLKPLEGTRLKKGKYAISEQEMYDNGYSYVFSEIKCLPFFILSLGL
jgi:hypothetical protein